jgi:hypothetical protein
MPVSCVVSHGCVALPPILSLSSAPFSDKALQSFLSLSLIESREYAFRLLKLLLLIGPNNGMTAGMTF